ncbi:uncharacterized protein RCC_07275 [Ramularia collo-cygni]|uniref:RNase III domain-containing protein n=1 Tax=Ramularia collo-cygni TaxID=112498 RepID=A0A2D3UUT6_9PEZI|nr:uncharacterized protein RCC_07275 [Ramularia collo-cygni]CZT21412.1 uncharacterized protein RCC_07275 [Ramularia collo-cygni]
MSKRAAPDDYHYQTPHKKRNITSSQTNAPTLPNTPVLPNPLPPLPKVAPHLAAAPFIHKSCAKYSQSSAVQDLSYERLEFVGDAYIELFASTLIFDRYPHLNAGRMSQLRESLVKNETLAEYSRAYGFDTRIEVDSFRHMEAAATSSKGNKGLNKVFADVFEAYLAAVVLSDKENGYTAAEKWAVSLWAPRVAAWEKDNANLLNATPANKVEVDPRTVYNPEAKQELNKRLTWSGKEVRITYEPWRDMIELKGDKIGQCQHFIAVYLTGYGVEKKLLGKGEGKSRAEAGQWAAIDAMHGEMKAFVAECAQKCAEIKEKRRLEMERKQEAEVKGEA